MDSLTQATLGAAIGEVVLGKKLGNKGALLGAIVATIPDLDILLLPFYSSIDRISIHRGFSHSIVFSVLAALIISVILTRIQWTKHIPFLKLLWFSWLALITHMLLDAFTTYGTQLFLPFSNYRVSFDNLNIVDPVYTIPLLLGVLASIILYRTKSYRSLSTKIGLTISSLYIVITFIIKHHVEHKFHSELYTNAIIYKNLLSVPVKVGSINWYGVAKTKDQLVIGKYNIISDNPINFETFPINDNLLNDLDTKLVTTLKWFSKGFYAVATYEGKIRLYNMQCDMQGVRTYGNYKAPTAFYFELYKNTTEDDIQFTSGMHDGN